MRVNSKDNKMKYFKNIYKYLILSISILGMTFISSCSTTLNLPAGTDNMEKVYLLKYSTWGHHSLAFYRDGKFIEYTYGDWELFALNKRDGWTAWKNMTFNSQGALGRKLVDMKPGEPICKNFVGCETVVHFQAPTKKVNALELDLHKKYNDNIKTEVYNVKEGVYFVKHDAPYWGFHNCNHQLVEWLEFLGADVRGRVFYKPTLIEGMQPKSEAIEAL